MAELANPTVALGVKVPQGPLNNPFELIGNFASAQKSLVEAQGARQLLAARQRAGQIISQSPDLDTAVQNMMKDPLTSAYTSDVMSTLQGISSTIQSQKATQQSISASKTSQAGEAQTQAANGLQTLMKVIGSSTPDTVRANTDAVLQTLSPTSRTANAKAVDGILTSLTAGLDDPNMSAEDKQHAYAKRLAGTFIGAGGSANDFAAQHNAVVPSTTVLKGMGPNGEDVIGNVGSPDLASPATTTVQGQPAAAVPHGLSTSESAAQSGLGAAEADTSKQMSEVAAMAPASLRSLDLLDNAMKVVRLGGGASNRSALASTAQMLQQAGAKIPNELISELANGKPGEVDGLPATQFIANELRNVSLNNLKTAQESLGRASAPELNAVIDSLTPDSDPKTIQTVVDKTRYALELAKDRSEQYVGPYSAARKAGEIGANSSNEWYNLHRLDAFNAAFEKKHPGVIGAPMPAPEKTEKGKKDDAFNNLWGN